MNIENVTYLIDRLESIDDSEYDQRRITHDCGTPACIAGHAIYTGGAIHLLDNEVGSNSMYILDCAAKYLELSEDEKFNIFRAFPFVHGYKTTKQEAVRMLKNFLEIGEVVWRKENEC